MYTERLLRPNEVSKLIATLEDHHKATLADGMTIVQFAITQHNIIAVSKIYKNIRVSELAVILDLSATQTEQIVCTMIREKRLKAKIDQIENLIEFEQNNNSLAAWDVQIGTACIALNSILSKIQHTSNVHA